MKLFNQICEAYAPDENVKPTDLMEAPDVVIAYTFATRIPRLVDIEDWSLEAGDDLLPFKDIEVDGNTVMFTLLTPAKDLTAADLDFFHDNFTNEFPTGVLAQTYSEAKKKMTHPPRFKGTIKAMMKHKDKFSTDKDSDKMNPYAVAWSMHKKGAKPHYKLNKNKRPVLKKKYKKK